MNLSFHDDKNTVPGQTHLIFQPRLTLAGKTIQTRIKMATGGDSSSVRNENDATVDPNSEIGRIIQFNKDLENHKSVLEQALKTDNIDSITMDTVSACLTVVTKQKTFVKSLAPHITEIKTIWAAIEDCSVPVTSRLQQSVSFRPSNTEHPVSQPRQNEPNEILSPVTHANKRAVHKTADIIRFLSALHDAYTSGQNLTYPEFEEAGDVARECYTYLSSYSDKIRDVTVTIQHTVKQVNQFDANLSSLDLNGNKYIHILLVLALQ